jgi:hypothetical protein
MEAFGILHFSAVTVTGAKFQSFMYGGNTAILCVKMLETLEL